MLLTSNQLTFSRQSGELYRVPVPTVKRVVLLHVVAYLLQDVFHELSVPGIHTFLKGALYVGSQLVLAFEIGFHCCGTTRTLSY